MESANYFHLQELDGLEMIQAQYHQQKFSRHSHEGFCIGVIEDGAQQFFVLVRITMLLKAILSSSMLMKFTRGLPLLKVAGHTKRFTLPQKCFSA